MAQSNACVPTKRAYRKSRENVADVCDCKRLKDFAFQTHVRCYTQQAASVCRLPISDLVTIYRIIDSVDLLDPYGLRQILGIIRICIAQSALRSEDFSGHMIMNGVKELLADQGSHYISLERESLT